MPPDTDVQVLRRHGLHELADWAENPVLAPAYARQSQYWLSVLGEPAIPDFEQPEFDPARDFEFDPEADAELPDADLPFLFPLFGDIPAVACLDKDRISAPLAPLVMQACRLYRAIYPSTGAHTHIDSG